VIGNPDKLRLQHTRGTRESVLRQNSQNFSRAPTLNWTRARNSVEPERILTELSRSSHSEDSQLARKSSGPQNLTSLSTLIELKLEALCRLNSHFLHTFCREEQGVFIGRGLHRCFRWKWGSRHPLVRPAGHLGSSSGQVSLPHWLSHLGFSSYRLNMTRVESVISLAPNPGVGPTIGRLGLIFLPHHLPVSYYLRLPLVLYIMKGCMDFGSYVAFPSSDVPEMVDQQNSWKFLVIRTYLLYLEWNLGLLAVDMCILWPPTPPTLRVLLVPEQKKRI
jgi:hypothetical protein